ncbi:uncharacterized protein LOC111382732 [Olea europaea var. sylvestris]|uniref:uncharacterized protein LOC111382732 n=1 Tax=Olea europaea var. sylvestris TaxID=158386 RepID=UPI000C1D4180|nr:uncharacterized protein LOC111382732 [Olea europaea var. sylvestris]
MLRACVLQFKGNWDTHLSLMEFAYNNSYHSSTEIKPFEALYDRKCRTLVCWDEVGERKLLGPEYIQITTEKVKIIKEKLKTTQDRLKNCADRHPSHVLGSQSVELKENLTYEEKPVQISDRKEHVLRSKTIPLVKVLQRYGYRDSISIELILAYIVLIDYKNSLRSTFVHGGAKGPWRLFLARRADYIFQLVNPVSKGDNAEILLEK